MGKSLIIKGADFSANGISLPILGIPDAQFLDTSDVRIWQSGTFGYALTDQHLLQGKTLKGVRLNVTNVGSVNIYKASSYTVQSESDLTLVATATAISTGLQNIDFSTPVQLGENEYLVFGAPSDTMTLKASYHTSINANVSVINNYAVSVGSSGIIVINPNSSSLDCDFYC